MMYAIFCYDSEAVTCSWSKEKDAQVRRAAAYVLGQLGPAAKEAIPMLTQALKDESAEVRQALRRAQALDFVRREYGP